MVLLRACIVCAIAGVRSYLPLGPVPIWQRDALVLGVETAQSVFEFEQKQPVPRQKAARVVRIRIVYQVLVDLKPKVQRACVHTTH